MPTLEIDDLQSGILAPRPSPYAGLYLAFRVDDVRAGRAFLGRLAQRLRDGSNGWITAALTHAGLAALGVPRASLDSFPLPFREGMAARASLLGDEGESAPERWEAPFRSGELHVCLSLLAPDQGRLDALKAGIEPGPGLTLVWTQSCHALPGDREAFGFRDGISHPAIAGSGIAGSNPHEEPLAAGEFVLGYPDETGGLPAAPTPDVLGRNGTFVVWRKLYQDVAAFRRYLRAQAADAADEERLAAKMVGRWRSGAPLALCPERDDAAMGADPQRRNAFQFGDDPDGLRCPVGAHIRRMNPRDGEVVGQVRLHRMIRRGASYGPPLPEGVLEDDGADRGLCFVFVGAHLDRQFEFVQSQWLNQGSAFGLTAEKDPLSGPGSDAFTVPTRPIRRRLRGLPRFVVTRGGAYCFAPSLSALRWLASLES